MSINVTSVNHFETFPDMFLTLTSSKNFFFLLAVNTILGAAMPMLIILGGLAGLALAPSPALATFPPSAQVFAGLLAAGPFSWVMGRYGRKAGFVLGGGFAIAGGMICAVALIQSNFILLCAGHMFMGAALACYQYFRFAAAEIVPEKWQPVAISLMLTSGLVAALFGPQLFILSKDLIADAALAGAYVSISVLTLFGLCPLAFVRFDASLTQKSGAHSIQMSAVNVLRRKPIVSAMIVGAVSQAVMVLLMAPTPLAMIGHGFEEAAAGDVIRWHVVAMFAPSFFTGFLIKRFGTKPVVTVGLLLLATSALIAASGLTSAHFYGSLVLLGLGWNFGFIGATNMLASTVSPEEKSLVQGVNDTVIALASTVSAFAAGAIVAQFGWATLCLTVIPVLLLALYSLRPAR